MALSVIKEEGLLKIFRHLGKQGEASGMVALVNTELVRGASLRDIFSKSGPINAQMGDLYCKLKLSWVNEERVAFTFGTMGENGYCSHWSMDFDEGWEVCAVELDFVEQGDEKFT